ncbi:hypothetical protein D9619_013494 [Psilocybe cf. subviscida]|uniref:PAS domain-containing protein n=1 Tax=Psilocybe cf. subviscida TaxID=2480587 RepID=A0A8H5BI31_9AGAR|nr:hypothetical protein D9619_013494 [Psilocybe cf. subviscida]
MRSIPISYPALSAPSTISSTTTLNVLLDDGSNASTMHSQNANHPLHLMLLEAAPDFIHVVSLKGDFLYVAPSVRRVLGFEAAEMQGKGLASYAHPEDVVPLMRELKEASSMGPPTFPGEGAPQNSAGNNNAHSIPTQSNISSMAGSPPHPRPVDLLFRCRTKFGRYVWVEARGRLYVEPGKGRKAIILAGRAREMTCLKWADVGRAGGVARGVREAVAANVMFGSSATASAVHDGGYPAGVGLDGLSSEDGVGGTGSASAGTGTGTPDANGQVYRTRAQDAWGLLAGSCARTAVFASIGRGMQDTLGWTSEDLLGRGVLRTVVAEEGLAVKNQEGDEQGLVVRSIGEAVQSMRQAQKWLREQRRLRVAGDHQQLYHHQQAPVDLARVKKVACRLRTKAGGTLDCWVVIYRADVDDDDFGSEDMNGMKHGASAEGGAEDGSSSVNQQHQGHAPLRADAGASITPAPLVFQIRMMGAETVRLPAPAAASASLQALGISYGMPVWKASPGSQAGAVPSSPSASGALADSSPPSSSMPTAPAAHAALTTGAGDVFAELAVARGSSWQYELQQLRITNMRLKEELAELEAAEAALGVGPSNGEGTLQAQMQQAAMVVQPQPPHAQAAQRVQAPVYAQTQPPPSQSYPSYEPVSMYQQQQDMYQYEQPQSMDLDLDYSYSGHLQQSFFAQPTPPPPPPPRRHTVSTAPGASVPSTPTQNSSNAYFHHPQPQQPLGSTLTALGDDDEASFLSGIRAALVKRHAAPTPQQQHQPTPDPRPVHKLPAPRIRPRPPQTSFNHPASEQIQQHILSSGALASSMSGHTYHQPHAEHQHQHQPHQMHQPQQQQQQAPLPVSMPMSLSATRWPSALTGYFNNGASSGDVEDASRKRSWSAVDRTG